ncbi:MAG: serine/threonine-protein kinase, partial [Gemmatimonadales bacterium]
KVLAQIRHPNVVPVHKAGEAAGFFYYVMDFMEGETLADRLKRGPLSREEVVNLGRDLLHAIEAVHALGIVHRDIKPANIFLAGDRAMLADFGISRASGPQTAEGKPGEVVSGTPGYMPPEQAFGWDITERTDLYAIAMVLYEALTDRRWEAVLPEKPADWSGVSRRLAPILRRALDFDPRMRWPDARSFRRALWRTRTAKYRRRTALLTLGGLAAGATAAWVLFGGHAALPRDLVVLPFQVEQGMDPADGVWLARLTHMSLSTLEPVSFDASLRLVERGLEPEHIVNQLNAKGYVSGTVSRTPDGLLVATRIVGGDREPFEAADVRGTGTESLDALGCQVGLAVVRAYAPDEWRQFDCRLDGRKTDAVQAFLRGEAEFWGQNWRAAAERYRDALELDSIWALPKWRLVNAQRWLRDTLAFDLADLYREVGDELGEQDRMLLGAWQTPFGPERIAKYEDAVTKYEHDPFPWLVFGDDLQMRGALLGIPLDSAATIVRRATDLDSTLAPAHFDLSWAAMRLGDPAAAAEALDRFEAYGVGEEPITPELYRWVALERFHPDMALRVRGEAVGHVLTGGGPTLLSRWIRFGPAFDVAPAVAAIAQGVLLEVRHGLAVEPATLVDFHVARGLSLVALGRTREALFDFDSVAALLDSPEAELHAAQWRVLPAALGIPPPGADEREAARHVLRRLLADGDVATRAAWALALDAYATDSTITAQEWARHVATDTSGAGRRLAEYLEAARLAALGQHERALAASAHLVPMTSKDDGAIEPFLRTAVYLSRAQWSTALDAPDADRTWLWYENTDVEGWPAGLPQAGEIDWAFATFARFHRGTLALERGDVSLGCRLLHRVRDLWTAADSPYQPLASEAIRLTNTRCRP